MGIVAALFLACGLATAHAAASCRSEAAPSAAHDYSAVMGANARLEGFAFSDLPGFTRSAYFADHALITKESRVWAMNPGWKSALTAHLVSKASGANFAMYMVDVKTGGEALPAQAGVERMVVVLDGEIQLETGGKRVDLGTNHYAYLPANDTSKLSSSAGAGLLVYERIYVIKGGKTELSYGNVDDRPILDTPGEVFALRKLLPATEQYDFNIHVMDFQPGEHLNVKEIHYNQHGLLMLEGKGIYRLADKWYPVTAGDAIWMAPYVIQWYASLGSTPTRYVILKDTIIDPLF